MTTRFPIRNANPLWRRLLRRLRRWRGAGMGKTHQVHVVTINGRRFKRVSFAHASEAAAVAAALETLRDPDCFPGLIMWHENQVWTDFVPGIAPGGDAPAQRRLIAEFFIRLYRHPVTRSGIGTFQRRLVTDLGFLAQSGVIGRHGAEALLARAERIRPTGVVVGYDYVDPVLKNFVVADGRAVAIDIEALRGEQLIGTGLAKARLRWLGDEYETVCDELAAAGGPDLASQYPWVELCFLAAYFKQKVLQCKPGHIQTEAFERILAREAG